MNVSEKKRDGSKVRNKQESHEKEKKYRLVDKMVNEEVSKRYLRYTTRNTYLVHLVRKDCFFWFPAKTVLYKRYGPSVRSRCLDIGRVLFCAFMK